MSDNYATPRWLKQFFEMCFDPNPINPQGLRETDALGDWQDWSFVNIPYSEPMPWIDHAIEENKKGKRIVLLVKVETSAKWWLKLVDYGDSTKNGDVRKNKVHFFYHIGRIYFNDQVRTPFSSALVFLA